MTDLQAGPELDRMVAERVMGGVSVEPLNNQPYLKWREPSAPHCFQPSTNIAHAWEVVGKLPLTIPIHGCSDLATFMLARRNNGSWWAGYETPYQDGNCAAVGDTAPLAICRAALKAVGQ